MIHFLPESAAEPLAPAPDGDPIRAATLARIASLRHAARLLGVTESGPATVSDATLDSLRPAAQRHAARAAREAAAGIEAALAALAVHAEDGREVQGQAIDRLARELDLSLAAFDSLMTL